MINKAKYKRGLAFYKANGEDWTDEEFNYILIYTGDVQIDKSTGEYVTEYMSDEEHTHKYIYDDHEEDDAFMYAWVEQLERDILLTPGLTAIEYNEIFKPKPKTIEEIIDEI